MRLHDDANIAIAL